jgi:thienamycin biosynthesis protein ThnN
MHLIAAEIRQTVAETVDDRIQRVVSLHLDPARGSRFWIERARTAGVTASMIRSAADLFLLGSTDALELRSRPLIDFIPQVLHQDPRRLRIAQTGGTTGEGTWTAYRDTELREAFVEPFIAAAGSLGFPQAEAWLFVGPSGPHVIGKVVADLAAGLGSAEPFMVDFDPRWARKLAAGSLARQRYLAHVVDQAMAVVRCQRVGVLFTTPPVLAALAVQMTDEQRLAIRGVHYGGMAIDPLALERFQTEHFPNAVHLSGYGNTLFGCAMELSTRPGRHLEYFPFGNRLLFEVIDGRVHFTRLDETVLIVRLAERDHAELISPPADAPAGFTLSGVRNPHTPAQLSVAATDGLY